MTYSILLSHSWYIFHDTVSHLSSGQYFQNWLLWEAISWFGVTAEYHQEGRGSTCRIVQSSVVPTERCFPHLPSHTRLLTWKWCNSSESDPLSKKKNIHCKGWLSHCHKRSTRSINAHWIPPVPTWGRDGDACDPDLLGMMLAMCLMLSTVFVDY